MRVAGEDEELKFRGIRGLGGRPDVQAPDRFYKYEVIISRLVKSVGRGVQHKCVGDALANRLARLWVLYVPRRHWTALGLPCTPVGANNASILYGSIFRM
jgi:hypothetical protein